jgi:hypothetical protein
MEQIILSSNSTLAFAAAPSATQTPPDWFRRVAIVIACSTVLAFPSGPMSESGLRPYHAPLGAFARAKETVAKRLTQLQSLVDDQGAVVVSDHLVAHAQRLLERLPAGMAQPRTAASADGEIGMSWAEGDRRFEAVLDPDDRLVWITKVDANYAPGGDVSVLSDEELSSFYLALEGFYGRV